MSREWHEIELSAAISYWHNHTDPSKEPALFWSWYEPRNFGDWITPWLYRAMTGKKPRFCPVAETLNRDCIYGAGSILRRLRHPGRVIVWGSGIIDSNDTFATPKEVVAVRGPLTQKRMMELGYNCPDIFGDPAILLPVFFKPALTERRKRYCVIPHFVDYDRMKKLPLPADFIIDVCQPVESVINDICACDCVFSSSLHGIIVAHAYGVPAVWIKSETPIMGDDVKFRDYFASVGLNVDPLSLPEPTLDLMASYVGLSTLPDQSSLRPALLATCPFGKTEWRRT